jgi:PPOX class probable F420-dependent enzyme
MDAGLQRQRVESARVARLATLGADERPHIVPICFALEKDVLYSAVDEKPKRTKQLKRLENIRVHPRVSVLVDYYEDDWSRLWWVRLDGTAQVTQSGDEHDHALALLTEKYEQYRVAPPTGPVIVIRVHEWGSWSAAVDPW